ncbi:site-specific integrase [Pseudoclavibacter endophyticus]|uniref:Site-specific integrase n=1 Tax=Pseudoclavibacter endophyticus TaxID=1778590 RepID=A0A6H9WLK0_9MICO|nr:site-specific integrase [Pseudoclavibacter endophyticus]KAB1648402.1 site-specific integrase [Pseudoclavibacter endophyticus]GGA72400.1 site-specific integrase [Pseudoclavibacter endophyticus]
MATIEAYETKSGTRYRVRYRTPDHRQTDKRGFKTKRDAGAFAASVEVAKLKGEYVAPSAGRVTVSELAPRWLASKGTLKPSSRASTETAWRVHVQPRWGSTHVSKVTHTAVQLWVSELAKTKSPSLVRRVHVVLASILDIAVHDRLVPANRARGVTLPRRRQSHRPYLSIREVETVAEHSGEHADLVRVLAYVGLRWSEAIALRGRHVDVQRQRIAVVENAVQTGQRIDVGTPKGHEQRSVPIPRFLIDELEARIDGPEDLLFGEGKTGYPMRPDSKRGWFVAAVKRAQATHRTMPTVTLHDLRHSAASIAVSAGANVKAVQRMLGHSSAAMTLDVYADLFDADLDTVAANIDAARAVECGQNVGTGTPGTKADAPTSP